MPKRYTDELKNWVEKQETISNRRKYLLSFLAVRENVAEALKEKYPMKIIWEHLFKSGKIEFHYETFRRYVKQHIREKENTHTSAPESDKVAPKEKASTPKPTGFNFNAKPEKKDLI